jgi:arylsulfatase A-like enzyme
VVRYDAALNETQSIDDNLLGNIDFAPTVLALTGATGSPGCGTGVSIYQSTCVANGGVFDGLSFAPLILGTEYTPRNNILIEHWDPSTVTAKVPTYCAVRSKTEMLIRYWANDTTKADWEGYDLIADPDQMHSLVYSATAIGSTVTPSFRAGGQQVYDDMIGPLRTMCSPQPPEYPGF